jgi:hypothetical protein
VVGRRQRADETDAAFLDQCVVVGGVLPGVVDQGEIGDITGELPVAGDELFEHGGELGDVGAVAGIGVGEQWDAAIAGHHQPEADQAQVDTLLFGFAALSDGGPEAYSEPSADLVSVIAGRRIGPLGVACGV